MSMMRIKPSTFGGWAEEGPLVVKRRKSERQEENGEKAGKTERWSFEDGIVHVNCSTLFHSLHVSIPLHKLSPSASSSWPEMAHALPPRGWCSFPLLGLALLFLRSAFMWPPAT